MFQATANSNDPNLTFDLVSSGSFKDKYPTGKIKLNIDVADLEKLNLHAGPMKRSLRCRYSISRSRLS
jgi:hypothetical protein